TRTRRLPSLLFAFRWVFRNGRSPGHDRHTETDGPAWIRTVSHPTAVRDSTTPARKEQPMTVLDGGTRHLAALPSVCPRPGATAPHRGGRSAHPAGDDPPRHRDGGGPTMWERR